MKFRRSFLILSFLLWSPFNEVCFAEVASPIHSYYPTAYPTISIKEPTCGDGEVSDQEECDDANASNSDSCSVDCRRIVGCGPAPGPKFDDARATVGENFLHVAAPVGNEYWTETVDGGVWTLEFDTRIGPEPGPNGLGTYWRSDAATIAQTWKCVGNTWTLITDVATGSGWSVHEATGFNDAYLLDYSMGSISYTLKYKDGAPEKRTGTSEGSMNRSSCSNREYSDEPAADGVPVPVALERMRVCKDQVSNGTSKWEGYPAEFASEEWEETRTETAGGKTIETVGAAHLTLRRYEPKPEGGWKFLSKHDEQHRSQLQIMLNGTVRADTEAHEYFYTDPSPSENFRWRKQRDSFFHRNGKIAVFRYVLAPVDGNAPVTLHVAEVIRREDPHIPESVDLKVGTETVDVEWNETGTIVGDFTDAKRQKYREMRDSVGALAGNANIPEL